MCDALRTPPRSDLLCVPAVPGAYHLQLAQSLVNSGRRIPALDIDGDAGIVHTLSAAWTCAAMDVAEQATRERATLS
jgi:hypothetical protein